MLSNRISSMSQSCATNSCIVFPAWGQSTSVPTDRYKVCCVTQDENGRRPHAYNREDAASLVQIAHKVNEQASNKVDVDEVQLLHSASGKPALCMHQCFH